MFPDGLDTHGVSPYDQLGEIPGNPNTGVMGAAIGQAHFTKSGDAFVRIHADTNHLTHHVGLAFEYIHTCNFQIFAS